MKFCCVWVQITISLYTVVLVDKELCRSGSTGKSTQQIKAVKSSIDQLQELKKKDGNDALLENKDDD